MATENNLGTDVSNQYFSNYQTQNQPSVTTDATPRFELKQPLLVVKKSKRKRKRTAKLQLLNMWIDPDITRLFIPRLKDIGKLSLNLHYSLKRSPYLLLDYERVTLKTKFKSNGMLQHEAYYNMGIEGAIIGIKVRGEDPLLYFRYRFK
ncbi:hypothetical protein [Moritella sp. Urea-trap-13]|uniref:hypothetical protein n=1 Tax=Moritella sp. Urea-trap-13 TaxID=2058327 RepID=UPI000C31CBFB|nr:hypothetical protein [Moritella sp. Urea-trap-13]PKH05753.1 hypothetical protein CXF93_16125 [Moritella sp. Urea-trap-13]